MQRYIRDYKEFFSPTARQSIRGRKFTDKDLKVLFATRHLYFQRCRPEEIRAALAGEMETLSLPAFEIMDDLAISQATRDHMNAAQNAAARASRAALEAAQLNKAAAFILDRFKHSMEKTARIATLEEKIAALEKEISYLKNNLEAIQDQPKPIIKRSASHW